MINLNQKKFKKISAFIKDLNKINKVQFRNPYSPLAKKNKTFFS